MILALGQVKQRDVAHPSPRYFRISDIYIYIYTYNITHTYNGVRPFFDTERFWCLEVTRKRVFAPQATPGYGDGTGYWNKRCAPFLKQQPGRTVGDDGGGRRSGMVADTELILLPSNGWRASLSLRVSSRRWPGLWDLVCFIIGNPRGKKSCGSHWTHSEIQLNIHNPQWFKIKRYQMYQINCSIWI